MCRQDYGEGTETMKLVIGGAFQGKLAYAKERYDVSEGWIDGRDCAFRELETCRGIFHFHEYVRRLAALSGMAEEQEAGQNGMEAERERLHELPMALFWKNAEGQTDARPGDAGDAAAVYSAKRAGEAAGVNIVKCAGEASGASIAKCAGETLDECGDDRVGMPDACSALDACAQRFAAWLSEKNPDVVIVTNELGYGIVPIDRFDREYRELDGRICTCLAARAQEVVRVVCGMGVVIKTAACDPQ